MKSDITTTSRRRFLRNTLLAGTLSPLASAELFAAKSNPGAGKLKVYIFSKHLQFLNYKDLAEAAKEMGFDGIDLAVRPGGHVEPDRVEDDLPKAVEAMRKVGFTPSHMTTAVNEAGNATDKKLLTTASELGFKYYRMNWYNYPENKSMPDALNELSEKVDLTLANLSILKTGKAKAIRFSTLESICKALDCQPGDLLEYTKE